MTALKEIAASAFGKHVELPLERIAFIVASDHGLMAYDAESDADYEVAGDLGEDTLADLAKKIGFALLDNDTPRGVLVNPTYARNPVASEYYNGATELPLALSKKSFSLVLKSAPNIVLDKLQETRSALPSNPFSGIGVA